ncbi:MAG: FAD-dependent thymidylate synthase [Thermoguttaceae bacterium]|jgi:thymidylate synthase (FAD)
MSEIGDALRWKKFPVLDDGFVCLADWMGSDDSVVQAARVSYGTGTKRISDDRTLIRYLLRHHHTTPFEMAEVKLLVRVPMDSWRQWVRHRTASINEYSTRYSIAIDSAYRTEPDGWRLQAKSNRQGSEGELPLEEGADLSREEAAFHQAAHALYTKRIERGIAREQARKDLPLSTYTEAYWKIDLHNLLHFLALRMEPNAQWEIRRYAVTIAEEIVRPLFPVTYEAFLDYDLGAVSLTRLEQGVISRLSASGKIPASSTDFLAAQDDSWRSLERCRERDEALEKLQRLGLVLPE